MAANIGRRLYKGAATTAVAALAVAALSASQAPGAAPEPSGGSLEASDTPPSSGTPVTGNSPYYTDLPPLNTPDNAGAAVGKPVTGAGEAGIPATVLAAYKQAERSLAESNPECRLPWQLLAAIGKVESGQARGGRVDANGTTLAPILGPVLNGVGFANISDTDKGAFDGDSVHDRAVGPMQFIPSTWATWGQDANGDGRKDPNNIYDAALAAGRYLCHGGRDLTVPEDLDKAILGYNHSREYVRTVLSWFEYYKRGTHQVPDGTGVLPVGNGPDSAGSRPGGTSPGATPSPTPSPTPGTPGGGSSPDPSTPPPTAPGDKPGEATRPTTPPRVAAIENDGTGRLTATAGEEFTARAAVRVTDNAGKAVARQGVRFTVIGDTDTRFPGGRSSLVLLTGADGSVAAPALLAGEKTGTFTVRATVEGRTLAPVDLVATVHQRVADQLKRTDDMTFTAAPGTAFAERLTVAAACKGAAAPNADVTVTVLTAAGEPAGATSPSFGSADGPVRTLTLRTGAGGLLKLPELTAGETAGTFLLRLSTPGGASLDVEVTVVAPEAPEEASPSPSPSATG
ncbi:lytic murein transglycosylase [Streptomyces genisteinicus]|uniref:Lytic murein transglycosylase n=1 Tax=Streptomyces genisteinicus TaxID=2768068 RepID=A0A7H0HQF5_9ACTN|nr:lytic murein transglycosylase [Streptomyces genisteinicus]QNP62771.1 lytic murein transglycosylase [Streptomyces genisteinicus]